MKGKELARQENLSNAEAVGAQNMIFPAMGMALHAAEQAKTESLQSELDSTKERMKNLKEDDEVSLGDLNPLIHFPDLSNKSSVDALRKVSLSKIAKYDGIVPTKMESTLVTSLEPTINPQQRFVSRFEVSSLSDRKIDLLEKLVMDTYPVKVRTRTGSEGEDIRPNRYPPVDLNDAGLSNTSGWYMGPNMSKTDSLHMGLFVYRDEGNINKKNFSDPELKGKRFIIEIREAAMHQTDLVEFITQVSSILANGKRIPASKNLLYETYYDLIRLGLKNVSKDSVHGMDETIDHIKRSLLIPLANKDLSEGIMHRPESILMVGVPGTGKTLAVQELLQEETGVFILPLDPLELIKELQASKEKQTLMPRIAQVSRKTGKKVVLHVDDIENMVQNEATTHSTLLNLMAGIRENDFYIIASTNDPDKIDKALLQPQRFGVWLHCGLPVPEARREILSIHTQSHSRRLGEPLFPNQEMRDMVLDLVTGKTDGYTPRFIAEIANIAKSHLESRIAKKKGKISGLTEKDLKGTKFIPEDWEYAFQELSSRYDKEGTILRDGELQLFVKKHEKRVSGFRTNDELVSGVALFSREDHNKLDEIAAKHHDTQ